MLLKTERGASVLSANQERNSTMAPETIVTAIRNGSRMPAEDRVPQKQGPDVAASSALSSIVIPCCGQLEYSKLCVPSLLKYT
jgi:hypothetical protein